MAENEVLIEKPKGWTLFELCFEGGYPCCETGVYLYFDGRVFTKHFGLEEYGVNGYSFLGQNMSVVSEVKALIKQQWSMLTSTPPCLDKEWYVVCDGGRYFLKFRGKKFYSDSMKPSGDFENIGGLLKEIADIFRKNGIETKYLDDLD